MITFFSQQKLIRVPAFINAMHSMNFRAELIPSKLNQDQSAVEVDWIDRLNTVVKKHISDSRLTVSFLSKELYLSRRQLQRRVYRIYGLTPSMFIREQKFSLAQKLLVTHQVKSVKSAAHAVGYKDVAHFSEQFKIRFGRLPSSFIEKNKKC